MTVVVDASLVVAALISSESNAAWAATLLRREQLASPHLMLSEAANVLRRRERAGELSSEVTGSAHADLLTLPVALYDYADLADRIWELRHTITIYDAWYVTLAEALDVPLATLDMRLARAPGARCEFLTPPA